VRLALLPMTKKDRLGTLHALKVLRALTGLGEVDRPDKVTEVVGKGKFDSYGHRGCTPVSSAPETNPTQPDQPRRIWSLTVEGSNGLLHRTSTFATLAVTRVRRPRSPDSADRSHGPALHLRELPTVTLKNPTDMGYCHMARMNLIIVDVGLADAVQDPR
jgi:hypothetical protein